MAHKTEFLDCVFFYLRKRFCTKERCNADACIIFTGIFVPMASQFKLYNPLYCFFTKERKKETKISIWICNHLITWLIYAVDYNIIPVTYNCAIFISNELLNHLQFMYLLKKNYITNWEWKIFNNKKIHLYYVYSRPCLLPVGCVTNEHTDMENTEKKSSWSQTLCKFLFNYNIPYKTYKISIAFFLDYFYACCGSIAK